MSDDSGPTRRAADRDDHFIALPAGTMLGKYRLDSVLGQGGFGITYRAFDTALDRPVAIKEYLPSEMAVRIDGITVRARSRKDEADFTWGLTRFLDEAKALARFDKVPAIVRVHDYLQANGTAYMVMALVEGVPLAELYRRHRTLPEEQLKPMALTLLEGLERVHVAGFLHRDIKPANILIGDDGVPTLIDFGAARQALGEKSRSITGIYTPGYAPFEQYTSSGKQGPWTDIYALAATLYEGIAGKVPPQATDRIREDEMVPAARAGAGRYSANFLAAIDHGLGVFESGRPAEIAQWRGELEGKLAVPAHLTPAAATPPPATRAARPRGLMIGAAVVIVALAGGAVALLGGGGSTPKPTIDAAESAEQRAQRLAEQARQANEEARKAQDIVAGEAKKRADQEARLKAEEEARQRGEDDARRQAEEAKRKNEEARRSSDEAAKRQADEEAKRLAEQEAQRKRLAAEKAEAEQKAADAERQKAIADLAEARRQADEAKKQVEEMQRQAEKARQAAEAEAKKKAEDEAKAKLEEEAKRKAEAEARKKSEEDAKRKAEDEAKKKSEADAKKKADDEAKKKAEAEAKKKTDEEAKRKAAAPASAPPPAVAPPTQQAAAGPPNSGDVSAYVAKYWPSLKPVVLRTVLASAKKYGMADTIFSQGEVQTPRVISANGDTVILAAKVSLLDMTSGATDSANLQITVKGFPNSATVAEIK